MMHASKQPAQWEAYNAINKRPWLMAGCNVLLIIRFKADVLFRLMFPRILIQDMHAADSPGRRSTCCSGHCTGEVRKIRASRLQARGQGLARVACYSCPSCWVCCGQLCICSRSATRPACNGSAWNSCFCMKSGTALASRQAACAISCGRLCGTARTAAWSCSMQCMC